MNRQAMRMRAAAIEAAINEHQKQERPWLREQFQHEYVLHEINRVVLDSASRRIERLLKNAGAKSDLQRLVANGCDRRHIIRLLVMLNRNELPQRWLGFKNRGALKSASRKLQKAEDVVRHVHKHISFLSDLPLIWVRFGMSAVLPTLLQKQRSFIDLFANSSKATPDSWKELLVLHVFQRTRAPFDREVSRLIAAAVPGHGGYSPEAHGKWRSRNGFLGDLIYMQ